MCASAVRLCPRLSGPRIVEWGAVSRRGGTSDACAGLGAQRSAAWHSELTLKNNTDQPVTYTPKHIPYYGSQVNAKSGQVTRYQEQVVEVLLQKGEERKMTLQDRFGWAADQMSSMEGCLLVGLSPGAARTRITLHLLIVPNDSGERLHDAFR